MEEGDYDEDREWGDESEGDDQEVGEDLGEAGGERKGA